MLPVLLLTSISFLLVCLFSFLPPDFLVRYFSCFSSSLVHFLFSSSPSSRFIFIAVFFLCLRFDHCCWSASLLCSFLFSSPLYLLAITTFIIPTIISLSSCPSLAVSQPSDFTFTIASLPLFFFHSFICFILLSLPHCSLPFPCLLFSSSLCFIILFLSSLPFHSIHLYSFSLPRSRGKECGKDDHSLPSNIILYFFSSLVLSLFIFPSLCWLLPLLIFCSFLFYTLSSFSLPRNRGKQCGKDDNFPPFLFSSTDFSNCFLLASLFLFALLFSRFFSHSIIISFSCLICNCSSIYFIIFIFYTFFPSLWLPCSDDDRGESQANPYSFSSSSLSSSSSSSAVTRSSTLPSSSSSSSFSSSSSSSSCPRPCFRVTPSPSLRNAAQKLRQAQQEEKDKQVWLSVFLTSSYSSPTHPFIHSGKKCSRRADQWRSTKGRKRNGAKWEVRLTTCFVFFERHSWEHIIEQHNEQMFNQPPFNFSSPLYFSLSFLLLLLSFFRFFAFLWFFRVFMLQPLLYPRFFLPASLSIIIIVLLTLVIITILSLLLSFVASWFLCLSLSFFRGFMLLPLLTPFLFPSFAVWRTAIEQERHEKRKREHEQFLLPYPHHFILVVRPHPLLLPDHQQHDHHCCSLLVSLGCQSEAEKSFR